MHSSHYYTPLFRCHIDRLKCKLIWSKVELNCGLSNQLCSNSTEFRSWISQENWCSVAFLKLKERHAVRGFPSFVQFFSPLFTNWAMIFWEMYQLWTVQGRNSDIQYIHFEKKTKHHMNPSNGLLITLCMGLKTH